MTRNRTLRAIRFRAMNTDIEAAVWWHRDGEPPWDDVRDWFAYVERKFSRFLPDSELSRLNAAGGAPVPASAAMLEVLRLASACRELTGGLFDPAILPNLEAAGYAVSFERIGARADAAEGEMPPRVRGTGDPWTIHPDLRMVSLPKGTRIDLGGIVKGWAVDKIAGWLKARGAEAGLVGAGGDLRAWSDGADGTDELPPWTVDIADPWVPERSCAALEIREAAVATSSVLGRRWQTPQGSRHHLIDPRTGKPGASDVAQCTVVGETAADAEVAAKTICLLGSRDGAAWFRAVRPQGGAVLFTFDRNVIRIGSINLSLERSIRR
jgi:thiamine biosynthesis lipoprotein